MKHELLIRSADFEVSGDGRNLEGVAVRWDHPSMVSDPGRPRYWEEFDPRSTTATLKMRALRPLFVEHAHLLGSVGEVGFEYSTEGLIFRSRMTDSTYATATLGRVNVGELRSVSLGFRSIRHLTRSDRRGPVTRRTEVAIEEMSLAKIGQHDGTGVLAVRSADGTPRLDASRRRRALLGI